MLPAFGIPSCGNVSFNSISHSATDGDSLGSITFIIAISGSDATLYPSVTINSIICSPIPRQAVGLEKLSNKVSPSTDQANVNVSPSVSVDSSPFKIKLYL